ncbi:hypothetical protein J4456_03995 [Candidatus Pacearchaeota archaeon]|nr:hypothetical protein [Candidatus Pacearchaeota archaeon]
MAEKDKVFKGKLKQTGIVSYKDIYEYMYHMFMDDGYDVIETRYSEVNRGDSKNVEIMWTMSKTISSYFKFQISLFFLVAGLKKVTIKKDGQDVQAESATIEMDFTGTLTKDYNNEWESGIMKILRDIYDKYIIKNRIEDYESKLNDDVQEFLAQIKAFMTLEGQHNF